MSVLMVFGGRGIVNIISIYEKTRGKLAQLKRAKLRKFIKKQESYNSSKKFGKRELAYVSSVEKLLKDSASKVLLIYCLKVAPLV